MCMIISCPLPQYNIIGELISAAVSFILHSEPNENPPEFTLICRSEGGPVMTVTWQRNGEPVQEDSNHETSQIIVDISVNTIYHNILRVRGREEGQYRCNVSNNIEDYVRDSIGIRFSSFEVKGDSCILSMMFLLHHLHHFKNHVYSCRDSYSTHCCL